MRGNQGSLVRRLAMVTENKRRLEIQKLRKGEKSKGILQSWDGGKSLYRTALK